MEYLGERVKGLRKQNGMTLKELGEALEFNYSNLSKIERGIRKPNIELLEKMAEYFKVDISYFLIKNIKPPLGETNYHKLWNRLYEDLEKKNISIDELMAIIDSYVKNKE